MERTRRVRDVGSAWVHLVYDFRRVENQARQKSVGGLTLFAVGHMNVKPSMQIRNWSVYVAPKNGPETSGRSPLSLKRWSKFAAPTLAQLVQQSRVLC